eukprot:gene12789-biopygen16964
MVPKQKSPPFQSPAVRGPGADRTRLRLPPKNRPSAPGASSPRGASSTNARGSAARATGGPVLWRVPKYPGTVGALSTPE